MCSEDGSAPTGVMNSVKRSESKCVDYRFKANNTSFPSLLYPVYSVSGCRSVVFSYRPASRNMSGKMRCK